MSFEDPPALAQHSMSPLDSDRWIRRFRPVPAAPVRLVCLPHAGGSASFYHPLSVALAPELDVLAVQYPGRHDRLEEPRVESLERFAELVVEAISPWTDRPVALFGHSMGAVIAFEVARRMQTAGTGPAALFVSSFRAASLAKGGDVHLRSDDGIVAELQLLSGTAAQLLADDELLQMALPSIRSDYTAIENYRYRPGPPLDCRVHALAGDTDPKVDVAGVRAWAGHTTGPFDYTVFPGGHFYLNDHYPAVTGLITAILREAGLLPSRP